jgi:hypothetical protein
MFQRPGIVSFSPTPRATPPLCGVSRSDSDGIRIAGIVNRIDTRAGTGLPSRVVRTTNVFGRRPAAFGEIPTATRYAPAVIVRATGPGPTTTRGVPPSAAGASAPAAIDARRAEALSCLALRR